MQKMKISFIYIILFFFLTVKASFSNKFTFSEDFKINKVSDIISLPWGMTLLNKKEILVTSKSGEIYLIDLMKYKTKKIYSISDTTSYGQGGLLDIFNVNRKNLNNIFVCYYSKYENNIVVARFEFNKSKLTKKRIIFKSNYKSKSSKHFGCRFTKYNNTILFSIGDRGDRKNSQNSLNYPGSIIQLNYEDNKLYEKRKNWLNGIFSIGHRNPQGLIYIKEFNQIWSHEHGPKGGDEINIIKQGSNYGWPIVTYGKEYWGAKIGDGIAKEGYVDPIWKWTPSIAPSGMDYYNHDYFKNLKGSLLVGSLKFKSLYAIKISNQKPISDNIIFKNKIGRIRDVLVHPDGYILLLNDENQGGLYKMSKK